MANLKNISLLKTGSYSAIAVVICFSFSSFSYTCYPFFNSDAALAVLMSHDYHFPEDLYCWGQDRGGTLEMMISHCVISVLHTGPLVTASVIHFLLLTAGLLAAFHFIKKPLLRLALSVAWFFPSHFFIESVLYQFGIQFSLFMIGIYLFSKAMEARKQKSVLLSLSCIFMILNVWVLDLGLIPVLFLAFSVLFHGHFKNKNPIPDDAISTSLWSKKNVAIVVFWTVAGILFIAWAKIHADHAAVYAESELNDMAALALTAKALFQSVLVSFHGLRKPVETFYFYSVILLLVLLVIQSRKEKPQPGTLTFFRKFFLWQFVFGTILLLFSRQVHLSDVPVRYFSGMYLSFVIFILMSFDSIKTLPFINIWLGITMAASVSSALYESYFPVKLAPMVSNFTALRSYQPAGIIGSYWNSYVFSAIDPANIKATPHDRDNVRNTNLAIATILQPRLLLVQNEWLQSFPDSITQFGTRLLKKGEPFLAGTYVSWNEVNNVIACEYTRAHQ